MKKASKIFVFSCFALGSAFAVVGCGPEEPKVERQFDFAVKLKSGHDSVLYMNSTDRLVINEYNVKSGQDTEYTFKVDEASKEYVDVTRDGLTNEFIVTPKKVTDKTVPTVSITFGELNSFEQRKVKLKIKEELIPQNAGVNYASETDKREEILGKLENYAMNNNLAGITLFQEGAYVKYNQRVQIKAEKYITGYGLGILTEGSLTAPSSTVADHPTYYHSASSSDPSNINAWDTQGSQIADLNGYISASYWSTKMYGTDKYVWYPCLAADEVSWDEGLSFEPFNRPIPLEYDGVEDDWKQVHLTDSEADKARMFKRWRVYVKTGETGGEGIHYRTGSKGVSSFNNRGISINDYEFTLQMLLTESTKLYRGKELALDTTYGIKGGQSYYRRTTGKTGAEADAIWSEMKASGDIGINTGHDNVNGDYIDVEFLSPLNAFYGMYYLSSSLYTPIPKEFLKGVACGFNSKEISNANWATGAKLYGSGTPEQVLQRTICTGPFYLEDWYDQQETIFARNDDWYECAEVGRYNIPGVCIHIIDVGQDPDMMWNEFLLGHIDSASVPKSVVEKHDHQMDGAIQSVGDATFKLNVNSCSQERWDSLFGDNGTVNPGHKYKCKEWMSNDNFLKGLYWSINRSAFAAARGVLPSINYFADAYMSDGDNGISYNTTTAHEEAIKDFHGTDDEGNDNYGYDFNKATSYFHMAVNELNIPYGTKSNPTIIKIMITWMNQTDPRDYGDEIANYFEKAFNDESVTNGGVKLVVEQEAVAQWDKVYSDHLQCGKFDLGFGAISGNTLNPLNFMEVLKSNNSSGFTLNWGNDTSIIDPKSPIMYEGKAWSYDALWAAADHGSVVNEGKDVNPVDHGYKMFDGTSDTNDLYKGGSGCIIKVPFGFVDVEEGVTLELKEVQVYLLTYGSITIEQYIGPMTDEDAKWGKFTYENGVIKIYVSQEQGANWNSWIVTANKLDEKAAKETDPDKKEEYEHPFKHDLYWSNGIGYWDIEISYSLKIGAEGIASDNIYYIAKNIAEDKPNGMCFAR